MRHSEAELRDSQTHRGGGCVGRSVNIEQIGLLYRNAHTGVAVNLIVGATVTYALWSEAPRVDLVTWLSLLVLIAVLRLILSEVYRRRLNTAPTIGRWARLYTLGAALSGSLWGVAGVGGILYLHPSEQIFVAFAIGGMAIGAVAVSAAYLPAFLAFFVTSAVPLVVSLFLQGSPDYTVMGWLGTVFIVALFVLAKHYHESLMRTVRLSIDRQALVATLQTAHGELSSTNERLSNEVQERVRAQSELEQIHQSLEMRVVERTKALVHANQRLSDEVARRKQAQELLKAEKERAQVTLGSIRDAVVRTDIEGGIEYMNPVAERLSGRSAREAQGASVEDCLPLVHEGTGKPATFVPARDWLKQDPAVVRQRNLVLLSRAGVEHSIERTAAPVIQPTGELAGAVLVYRDVTEARMLEQRLTHQASHDSLTGLVNRREFEKRLERAVASAKRYGKKHALCYLDLDQFKIVNDTAGHVAGDQLLKQIASLLGRSVRARDTLARLGGDEFSLLLENCSLENASEVAETLVSAVREHRFSWDRRMFQVGVSVGIVPITAQAEGTIQLLAQADVACYSAKDEGRNRIHVFQAPQGEPAIRHVDIVRAVDIREALEQNRFRLYCQPIVPLSGAQGGKTSYEVLLRLIDPKGELLLPGSFIPNAERFGSMGLLDRWVIESAFKECARSFAVSGTRISVNLSGTSLDDESLLKFIRQQFARYQVDPRQVCFEITENTAIHNFHQTLQLMEDLKQLGCRFALDDFGSGLSSLSYLKKLPVDVLKIDGTLVRDMVEDRVDQAMVIAINELGHSMGIETIAEYAHSEAVVARLRQIKVDYAQGFALGTVGPLH